jgi:hypothetical protein
MNNQPRMRTVLDATLSLACSPASFTVGDLAAQVRANLQDATPYDADSAGTGCSRLEYRPLTKSGRWAWEVTTPRGLGCRNCGAPW